MSQRKKLIDVTYHSDDDTGMYDVGEIDHGIVVGELENYFKSYGRAGKDEIIGALAWLIYEVERRFRETQDKQPDQQAAKVNPSSPTPINPLS